MADLELKLKSQNQLQTSISESEVAQYTDQIRQLTEDKVYLSQEYEKIREMYGSTEQSLVDAKMMWAQLDMECDELTVTLKRKND